MNCNVELDKNILDAVESLDLVMKIYKLDYFIIGAMARDVLLNQVYEIEESGLATQDIDFGVSMLNWDNYKGVVNSLIGNGFTKDSKHEHRFVYKNGFPIDIVPFGEIANDGSIAWPPDQSKTMSVLGYEEAMNTAINISIVGSDVTIKIVSLVGFVVLKLISWAERYPERKKDAFDIRIILKNYISADNSERLYGEDSDMMENEDFDYDLSGARLLGRDIVKVCHPKTLDMIKQILEAEMEGQYQDRLAYNMDLTSRFSENQLLLNQKMIKNLYVGIQDSE